MAIKVPQVRQRGLPTTSGVRTPGPDAFGAGVGQAVQQAGGVLEDIALDMQERENVAKTREVDTYFTRKLDDIKTAYGSQTGKTAYEAREAYDQALQDLQKEAAGMLENTRQREMFAPLGDRKVTGAMAFGQKHAADSLLKWETDTLLSQAEMNMNTAASNYGTPEGQIALQSMMENVEDLGEKQGWPPEKVQAKKVELHSNAVSTRIQSMLESNPYAAEALFTEAKSDGRLTAADSTKLERAVNAYLDKQIALDLSDRLLAQANGDYKLAWEAAKQIDDRDQRLEVQRLIQNEQRMQDSFEREAKKKLHEAEWNKLMSKENPTFADLPPQGVVDPDVYAAMQRHLDWVARVGRNVTNDDRLVNDLTNMAGDQDRVEEFKALDLNIYRDRISPSNMRQLEKMQNGDTNAINEAATARQLIALGYKMMPKFDAKKDEDKAAEFEVGLQKALERAKQDNKGDLTFTEQEKIVRETVRKFSLEVDLPGTGILFDDETTMLELLGKPEYAPGNFSYKGGAVDELDVENAILKLEEMNKPITPTNIQQLLDAAADRN